MYDYLIVGAGPAGLTCAYLLGRLGYQILLVDSARSAGGCHRVTRVGSHDRLFTEHGPRLYTSGYVTMMHLLSVMGVAKTGDAAKELFVPYNFNVNDMAGEVLNHLSVREMAAFVLPYLVWSKARQQQTTMFEFMRQHKFSPGAMDYVDRLCRLTDGAGITRYTLWEFLMMFDQTVGYTPLQPRVPNDAPDGLITKWVHALYEFPNVNIRLGTRAQQVQQKDDETYTCKLQLDDVIVQRVDAAKVLLCVPPSAIADIKFVGMPLSLRFLEWARYTRYDTYVSVTFEWDHHKRKVFRQYAQRWEVPASEWGIAWVILSDYMYFPQKKVVISTAITLFDSKSTYTGKTANETTNENDLKAEVFRQLSSVLAPRVQPTSATMSPYNYYDKESHMWRMTDDSFVFTPRGYVGSSNTTDKFHRYRFHTGNQYTQVFTVGPHTGTSDIGFTTAEGAVASAVGICTQLDARVSKIIRVLQPRSFKQTAGKLLVWLILALIAWTFVRKMILV